MPGERINEKLLYPPPGRERRKKPRVLTAVAYLLNY